MKSVIASMIGYFFALSSCLFCAAKSQAMPIFPIKQGILDLRNWDPRQEPIFQAVGKAAFYWEKFILIDAVRPEDKTFIDFPGPWNLKSDYPVHGYASVRIHVILPVRQSLSIQFPWLWSSAEIYADGKLLRKQGTIARNRNLSNPVGMLANLVQIFPRSKEFDIVLHMSNFEVPLSGHVERLLIGTPVGIQNVHDKNLMVDTFMLGAIFIMALYHIMLFLLRRQDFSSLYFGLFCIAMAAYLSVSSISSIFNVFYPSSFRSSVLIYDSSWTLALPIFYLYLMSMFPKDFSRNLAFINMGLGIAAALLMQFLDVYALVDFSLYYQVSLPFMMLQIVFFLIKAARSRRQGALGMLLSLSMVCAGVLLDMLMLHGSVSYSPVASASVFFFIFSQSYFLSRRFALAFFRAESSESEVRKLAQEFKNQNIKISQLNETLEVRVEAQTRDIRSFMEHTPIAIFALQGHEALIHRDYSKQLELILECENIADQAILPLFFKGSSLSVDEYDQLVQALNAILDEPLIAFELNEGLLPRLLSRRNKQGQLRLFEAAWNPILDKDDRVERILVALTDVSEIRSLQNTARERAETLIIIGEILAVKDVEFARFIRSCKGFMKQNWQLFSCADHLAPDREIIKILFLNLHTMKGSARHLGFKKLCDIFHEHENYYTQLIKYEFETWDLEKIRDDLISIESSVLEYEKIAIDKLGRTMQDAHVVTVPILAAKQGFLELDHKGI
ncbi:MAG: Hpt domain-containing protein [Proteobacteria bacterium]|nr:Hpt domain-containing protein [Pseudomonadota bacterium]